MKNKQVLPLIIASGAGLIVAALVAWRQGAFSAEDASEVYRALCDAFFVPGAILVCLGLISFVAYGGFFDIFGYGFKSLKRLFTPFGKKDEKLLYYDYHVAKEAKRQKPRYYTLKVGLMFMLLAVICLILFYNAA